MDEGLTALTTADLLSLPPTVPLWPEAARIVGVKRTKAYELVKTGEWPTRVLRLGHTIRVPTSELLKYVGAADDLHPSGEAA